MRIGAKMFETYLFYNLILIASTFFVYLYEKSTDKVLGKLMLFISFLIIFLPAALRYNVGTDYWSYVDIFKRIQNGEITYVEPGYVMLNKVIIYLGLSVEWLFALLAFLIYFLAYKSYPKKNAATYHFLYITVFYLITFTSLRSALTFSITLIALNNYSYNKKFIPFLIWTIIGTFFHKSILLILIIPLLCTPISLAIIKRYKFILISLFIMCFMYRYELINLILNSSLAEALGYKKYIGNALFTQKTQLGSGLGVLLRAFPLVIFLLLSNYILKYNKRNLPIIIISILCLVSIIFAASIDIFSRLERVYYVAYILAAMAILNSENIKYRYFIVLIIILSRLFLFENEIRISKSSECAGARISPYVSIFNKQDDQSLKVDRLNCS